MKFIEVCMSFVCRCFDSGLQTGCFSWWFPVGVLWLKIFRRKKRPGRIPLFFAKRAQRDGLAYHLSRIGGHWCEGFIYLEGRCLNGWMEWKEADFVRIQTPQSRRYWFHDMFVGYVLVTYTGTMERERERVLFCWEDLPAIFLATRHKGHIVFVNTVWLGHVLTLCYNSNKMPQLMVLAKQWWAFAFHSSVRKKIVPVSRPAACLDAIHLQYSFVYHTIYVWCIKTTREWRPKNHPFATSFWRSHGT